MSRWHPRQEPVLSPIVRSTRRGEGMSMSTVLSVGSGLLAATVCVLIAFLTMTASDTIAERTERSNSEQLLVEAMPIGKETAAQSMAVLPDTGEPIGDRSRSMDLGRWQAHGHRHDYPNIDDPLASSPFPEDIELAVLQESEPDTKPMLAAAASVGHVESATTELLAVGAPALEFARLKSQRPPTPRGRPKVAIIIDDLGNNAPAFERIMQFDVKPTLAFLPYPDGTPKMAARARAKGFELILHMPMQPEGDHDPGPDALTTDLASGDIRERLAMALERVPGAIGVNNHMGSAFTKNRRGMDQIMGEIRARGLIFVDSRTTGSSVVGEAAATSGAASTERDVFLDHDPSPAAIRKQLRLVEKIARKYGSAVAIGHPRGDTLDALAEWLPQAQAGGLDIVGVRDIVAVRHCAEIETAQACDPDIFVAELDAR